MSSIKDLLARSGVHPEWSPLLMKACQEIDPEYLQSLLLSTDWLPGSDNLFAAFRRDLSGVRYVLFGESPYPRAASANGISFYDAAVDELWSETGLSKKVNRATSLRNILKTVLVAEGRLEPSADGKISQSLVAATPKTDVIQSIGELFDALEVAGFLMLNATPVLHPERKPNKEAKFWLAFLDCFLEGLLETRSGEPPTLVLWGKIAEQIQAIPCASTFPQLVSEHPYNLSFIHNRTMLNLFREIQILKRV